MAGVVSLLRKRGGKRRPMTQPDYEAAHKHSFKNREEVLASEMCGCFFCLAVFPPSEITSWCDEVEGVGLTAICPKCRVDAVIGAASGLPISATFLGAMNKRWFDSGR